MTLVSVAWWYYGLRCRVLGHRWSTGPVIGMGTSEAEYDQCACCGEMRLANVNDYECGWCFGTGIYHYNTDDLNRLTMPCPNRDCPKSPDWWHEAAAANAEDEAWEKRSRGR